MPSLVGSEMCIRDSCVALCGGLMLWCRCVLSFKMGGRCVLSFKMSFWVCGSRGVRDVHVISCTRVVLPGVFPTSAGWVPFRTLSTVCRMGTTTTAAISRRLRCQRLSLSGPLYSKQGAGTNIHRSTRYAVYIRRNRSGFFCTKEQTIINSTTRRQEGTYPGYTVYIHVTFFLPSRTYERMISCHRAIVIERPTMLAHTTTVSTNATGALDTTNISTFVPGTESSGDVTHVRTCQGARPPIDPR